MLRELVVIGGALINSFQTFLGARIVFPDLTPASRLHKLRPKKIIILFSVTSAHSVLAGI